MTIIKDKFPKSSNFIKDREPNNSTLLHFSFKYFDIYHKKFSIEKCQPENFIKFIERLKGICQLNLNEFRQLYSNKSIRAHLIKWHETTEPHGFQCFNSNDQLKDSPCFQFSITANKHGRVMGFLVSNIFHIVWFDVEHLLYSDRK